MALSQADLDLLNDHLTDNFLITEMGTDYEAMATWYDTKPTPQDLRPAFKLLKMADYETLFIPELFSVWVAGVAGKIKRGGELIQVKTFTDADYEEMLRNLVLTVIETQLSGKTTLELILALAERVGLYDSFQTFSYLLTADQKIKKPSNKKIQVELNPDKKRWKSLKLAEAPTATEIENLLNP